MTDVPSTAAPLRAPRHPFAGLLSGAGGIVKSVLTGPDGRSWAPGRIFAFATFVVAQCLVMRAAQMMVPVLRRPDQWLTFFAAVAGFQAATGGTCIALVLGIAPADPGGKWWGRDASPPPRL